MRIMLVSFLSFILSYWIYLSIHISVASGKCLEDQQSLLLQLKNNLIFNPKSSSKLKLWNQSFACCSWSGVTCDDEGHVIGLDLSGESISGGFDNSSILFSLQHLQKLNLADNNFNSAIPSGFNKLEKLTYLNLSYASFVGQIPIEISQLTRLVTLDISSLSFLTGQELKLENPNLQKLIQNLTSIRQLYLDGVSITAQGQEWCNALLSLPDLQELSMRQCNLSGPLDSSLARLENLSVIILDGNYLSSPVPETFANLKNLTTLSLDYCGLTGTFPQEIFQIETLSVIDISYNEILLGFFPDFPLSGSLQTLRVSNTNFSGEFPPSIGNMRHLSELDLSYCQFNGTLPNSLSNLTELCYVDLSSNSFTGPMTSFGMAKMHSLVSIDLRFNSMDGSIPSSLFALPLLQRIQLSYNQFSQLDNFTNVSSSILNTLDLSSNNLSGSFPASIFQLSTLSILELSSNKFNGSLELNKLLELRNLTILDLSYNKLSVNVNVIHADMSSFPDIGNLKLASCNLKTFPDFLRNQSMLYSLDLSDNQIQGKVPNWIWNLYNLESLNISHNLLTDLEGPLQNLTSNFVVLDLHHNQLQGPIPFFPKSPVTYLDYSSNKFSAVIPQDIGNYLSLTIFLSLSNNTLHGSIPDSLCNASSLQVLDLSNNNISGRIPSCLMNVSEKLGVLNLSKNKLKGPIPDMFPVSCALRTLGLQENELDGRIPQSLVNCITLEVLNLAKNRIIDGFPCFLKKISTLRVLVLRQNKFCGPIGCQNTTGTWHMIQIVDLAFNNFSGGLPGKYFTSWEAMMYDQNPAESKVNHIQFQVFQFAPSYYQDSVTVTSKGQRMELVKILTAFTIIDFSSNHFEGTIPEELMDFKALHGLDFSNNALSGAIPSSIGKLKNLESLDLSQNSLGGEIPVQLSSLSFLSYLNLSFNHLVGKIPTGTQLQSFQASSFEGNDGLYGPPLTEKPDDKDHIAEKPCRRLACSIDWNFISVEMGLVFGLGIVIGPLLFCKQWRVSYWQLVNKILCWIFPQLYLDYVTRRGQRYTVLRWWH
ncbi:receptor-like protein 7 [Gastrolobium bilobum]|uniref:receptor-like protein 7 n=1 Tax=Gastrolobium bilobum TaxID=150636 RepID=UPI002AB1E797|nr:receptor-like protein 7 [Gastrolobium bilobum]